MTRDKLIALLKLAMLVAFLTSAAVFFGYSQTGQAMIREVLTRLEGLDWLTARLIYVAIYIIGTVLLVPGTLLSFTGAVSFGPYEGTLFTWIGAMIGATLSFLLARVLGRGFVDKLLAGKFEAFDRRIREHGFTGLLLIRLLPIFPFNGVNFDCGLTGIRLRDYLLGTAIGILPGTFV